MNRFSRLIIVGITFTVLSFSLLFVSFTKDIKIPILNNVVTKIMTPISQTISIPIRFLSEEKDVLAYLISTYDENKELKATIHELEGQLVEKDTLEKENESLRQSLGLTEVYRNKELLPAAVTVRTPVTWNSQLIIDLGSENGVSEDMLVVANGGLIGVITRTELYSSTVKLLSNSDDFTSIPVKISNGEEDVYGILSGYDTDSNSFIVNQLNSLVEIPIGSNVVTSDLAGSTPSNIQIGSVSLSKESSNNLDRIVYVKPTAKFSNLYSVLVIGSKE